MQKDQVIEINSGCMKLRLNGHKKIELKLKKAAGNVPLPGPVGITVQGINFQDDTFKELELHRLDSTEGMQLFETAGYLRKAFSEIEDKIHELGKGLHRYAE